MKLLATTIVVCVSATQVLAQEKKPEGTTPASTPSPADAGTKSQASPPPSQPKSLDELLGVPKAPSSEDGKSSAEDAAEREQAKRLEKSLEEASLEDLVVRAVDGMKSAAERLGSGKDAGIGTQRIQEDVVKTLDRLLEEAQKQQQRQSSSSSSRRQSGKPQDTSADPGERNGQQSTRAEPRGEQNGAGRSSSGAEESSGDRSPDQVVGDGAELEEARIEWGRLPERVRELVSQGRRDRVSSVYERLTREYYRRLAEEASK